MPKCNRGDGFIPRRRRGQTRARRPAAAAAAAAAPTQPVSAPLAESLERRALLATPVGWTPLTNAPPGSPSAIMQLSDGSIVIEYDPVGGGGNARNTWARLTPDSSGSYLNGTWSLLASANISRLDFGSVNLRDGRILTDGGEYGQNNVSTNNAEIYDPVTNTWTMAAPQNLGGNIVDAMTVTLANGDVLIGPVTPPVAGATMIYHVATDTWTLGPRIVTGGSTDEESFVKLKDDTILTADSNNSTSERYVPWLNKWIADASVPVSLFALGEEGGGVLMPDGRVFYVGGGGNTAIYTPSGSLAPGSWAAGPTLPVVGGQQLGAFDAPIAMLRDGRMILALGVPKSNYPAPTYLYIYDPTTNSFTASAGAPNLNDPVFGALLLDLPDGNVLYTSRFGNNNTAPRMYVFNPGTTALTGPKPTISNIAHNADGSYTLTGTQFNGINEGNSYGDDQQQDTNFPLVRLTSSGGNVYYARTYNWSNMGVATGNLSVTTNFVLPLGLPPGDYSLSVVANGFASDPQPFTISTIGNAAPTVATPAAINPNPVSTGTTGALSVLGADDGGEANLTYTWTTSALPAGAAAPSFTINGSNAAKNTTATFYKKGTYTFKVYITDSGGLFSTSTVTVNVTSAAVPSIATAPPPPASVVGRALFYNNSSFDGNDPAANAATDAAAIATDKQALLPGQAAGVANYSSYTRGINGLIIDVANLRSASLSTSDFTFKAGNTSDPSTWGDAPAPASITVTHGAGTGGSDRIEIVWPDRAITNRWLRVSVNATAATGLSTPDVFYFGNLVGDTGGSSADGARASVDGADLAAIKAHFGQVAAIDSPFDINRSGAVSGLDLATAKLMVSQTLPLFTAPANPVAIAQTLTEAKAAVVDPTKPPPPTILPTPALPTLPQTTQSTTELPAAPAQHPLAPLPLLPPRVPWWAAKKRRAVYED